MLDSVLTGSRSASLGRAAPTGFPIPPPRATTNEEPNDFAVNEETVYAPERSALSREWFMLGRQWAVICGCTAAAIAMAAAFNTWARPVYTANAVVSFDFESEDPRMQALMGVQKGREATASEIAILRSRDMAQRVIQKQPPGLASELRSQAPAAGWRRVLAELRHVLALDSAVDSSRLASMDQFRRRLVVGFDEPPSTWVTLSFTSYDRQTAAAALNALLEVHLEDSRQRARARKAEDKAQSDREVTAQAQAVGDALRALTEGARNGRDPLAKRALAQKMLATLQDQLARASAETVARQVRNSSLAGLDEAGLAEAARAEKDDGFLATDTRLSATESRLRALKVSLGDRHPEVVAAQAEVDELARARTARLEGFRRRAADAVRQATETEASLRREIAAAEREAGASEIDVASIALERERATSEQKQLARSVDRAQDELPTVEMTIVQRAESPFAPSSPQRSSNLMSALAAGILTGLGIALLRERVSRTILDAADVKASGATLLGLVPTVKDPIRQLKADFSDPTSLLSEAYRKVLTYLDQRQLGEHGRVFVVSSASAGEGKTTTAASLAMLMSRRGSRVLLIDADLRRPALIRYFDKPNDGGLREAVAAQSLKPFAVTVAPQLDLLASGLSVDGAPEILGDAAFEELLRTARTRYDYVICDAPPLLPVVDALLVLPMTDGMILVAAAGKTHLQALSDALDHIRSRNGKLLGVVLNRVNFRGLQYRYYGKYSYAKNSR